MAIGLTCAHSSITACETRVAVTSISSLKVDTGSISMTVMALSTVVHPRAELATLAWHGELFTLRTR